MEKKDKKPISIWSWAIEKDDLKKQIDNYSTLKITESYRGISVLIVTALFIFSILVTTFVDTSDYISQSDILYSLIIYIPILFFVYKGHRWAIIALMILWTFEKGYSFLEFGGFMNIFWWAIVMPYFYKALKVENERKKQERTLSDENESSNQHEKFCDNCGKPINLTVKFCQSCGNKIM